VARFPKGRRRGVVGRSILRWDGGDAEVEDPPSVMSQHQEYVEDLEAESRNNLRSSRIAPSAADRPT
jgi:hypothetical protein